VVPASFQLFPFVEIFGLALFSTVDFCFHSVYY
jgi:hypothetical protein